MQAAILFLHNILRWILLILLVVSILKSYTGWKGKKSFSPGDAKIWLFTMISAHTNLLIGLYLLFFGTFGIVSAGMPAGTQLMKDKFYRFFWVEHPFGMIIAIVLITLGRGMAKKNLPDQARYKKAFWFFFFALVVILATVPWPFREIVGRPWI
ncbi:MAG: hypothetical protein ACHQEM_04275 [Chitinophagales bacterium]